MVEHQSMVILASLTTATTEFAVSPTGSARLIGQSDNTVRDPIKNPHCQYGTSFR